MTATHCTTPYPDPPNIPSWAVPVANVSDATVNVLADPGAGNRRGVIAFCHGTQTSDQALPRTPTTNEVDFATKAAAVGWITEYLALPNDWSTQAVSFPANMANQCDNDGVTGLTYFQTWPLWADHVSLYNLAKYGITVPTIWAGESAGAWDALCVALQRPSTVGCIAHSPVTIWENVNFGFTNPFTPGSNTNVNYAASLFSGLQVPTIIGWGNTDGVVGFNSNPSPGPVSNIAAILAANHQITSFQSLASLPGGPGDESLSWPFGHGLQPADNTWYFDPSTGWVTTTLNPRYPVSF